ncbi:ABC transporter substrate-binding protein [Streptomyces sp. NPDC047315]|uniref:ABC transporter substrate-binding protein n=1 Tax=Streptomyces sp. NPDC047315 TaxID=3155142 RepID=UPI0033F967F9
MTASTTEPVPRTPRRLRRGVLRALVAFGLLLATAGCTVPGAGTEERVSIMVPWTQKAEFQAFYSVVKDFEHDTGVRVDVQVTRALTQQLDASVAAGSPPDLAVLPSVSAIARYTHKGKGLRPLDDDTVDIDAYLQPFRGLAQVRGTTYAVPVKVDVKTLVWYDSETTEQPPTDSIDALAAFARGADLRWCLGLASGPTSGWPGADWIADIMLADAGAGAYAQWASGTLPWTSTEVERAWSRWRGLLGDAALRDAPQKAFSDATRTMTTPSPTCQLAHGTRSALAAVDGEPARLDFVAPPTNRPVQVSGDFIGMFTADNPSARRFVAYLAGSEGQQSWGNAPGSSAFSAHAAVTGYANPVQQRIATMLQPRSGYQLCFSAADVLSPDVAAAFYRAVLDFADGANDLGSLLPQLQSVQEELGTSPLPANALCAAPP